MGRQLTDVVTAVVRDPFTILLAAAAAIQVMLWASPGLVVRSGWVVVALALFVVTCVLAGTGRARADQRLQLAAPFVLLATAGAWRAADHHAVNGFGALGLVSVIWLAFYGSRRLVWIALAGVALTLLVAPLVAGQSLTADDWRRAALALVVGAFVGPTLHSLVQRGTRAAARASALEPVYSRLDAVLRAATGHLIVACEPSGLIVEFNPGAERMLGWRADEVVGIHTPELFHDVEETRARAAELGVANGFEAYTYAARGGELDVRDWTFVTKTGERILVSLTLNAIRDAAGNVAGFVGIGTDVTAERAAARSLEAQREIYRLLVEHLPLTTVALVDSDLRCLTIGGHWPTKSGIDVDTLVGHPIVDFFSAADRPQALTFYREAQRRPVQIEFDLADGRCYEFAAVPVAGPKGEPLLLSLARDITDRRHAELERQQMLAALAVSEASFREAFEGAPIGVALTTAEGPQERFLRVNPAFATILGRRPADLAGLRVADVTHPEDVLLQPDLRADRPPGKLRKRFIRPSGRAVWVEVSYAVVRDADGVPSHVVKQIQDINTIKESERALLDALEQQRAATASLREVDQMRTDLVGTISHELRTPLTSINGYLELLADEPLTAPQLSMLEVARRNAERLGRLVDNLLVLVRLDSADAAGQSAKADVLVTDILTSAVDTVRPEISDRAQDLHVVRPEGTVVVRGDTEQLHRALVNLLTNASKYSPHGGRIDVAATLGPGTVAITVTDTGIGIPAEEQRHLFTRFFRASTARVNAIGGNGLGLAIVKSIVERHEGQVSVESAPGAGSRFTITLPAVVPVGVAAGARAATE